MEYILPLLFAICLLVLVYKRYVSPYQKLRKSKDEVQKKFNNFKENIRLIHKFGVDVAEIKEKGELFSIFARYLTKIFNAKFVMLINYDLATRNRQVFSEPTIDEKDIELVLKYKPTKVEVIPNFSMEKFGMTQSTIFFPFYMDKNLSSLLVIGSKENRDKRDDIYLLTILTDLMVYIHRTSVTMKNLERSYFDTISLLANIVNIKDNYTLSHAERTRYYAKRICRELELPRSIERYIEYAALLHDVGKIAIDGTILRKPNGLTKQEREIIEQHPLLGAKMLEPITYLSPLSSIVLYHHEWFNGTGYPNKLKAEEIPLGARIIAVLDAYDAMVSDRPYRKALTKEVAINELKKFRGVQFDPKIVDVFLKILESEKG